MLFGCSYRVAGSADVRSFTSCYFVSSSMHCLKFTGLKTHMLQLISSNYCECYCLQRQAHYGEIVEIHSSLQMNK